MKLSTQRPQKNIPCCHIPLLSSCCCLPFLRGRNQTLLLPFRDGKEEGGSFPGIVRSIDGVSGCAGEMHRKDKRKFPGINRKPSHCSPKNLIPFPLRSHRTANNVLKTAFNTVSDRKEGASRLDWGGTVSDRRQALRD